MEEKAFYYTVQQVAKIMNVGVFVVRRLLKQGKLKGVDIGSGKYRYWRVSEEDLANFLKHNPNNNPKT
jgi:excisionase family DNA binding protein